MVHERLPKALFDQQYSFRASGLFPFQASFLRSLLTANPASGDCVASRVFSTDQFCVCVCVCTLCVEQQKRMKDKKKKKEKKKNGKTKDEKYLVGIEKKKEEILKKKN